MSVKTRSLVFGGVKSLINKAPIYCVKVTQASSLVYYSGSKLEACITYSAEGELRP